MQLLKSYTITEKIKNLSGRLHHIAKENNTSRDYIDQRIKSKNLLWNLSVTIAHLLLKIDFSGCSKTQLEAVIKLYNTENNTELSVKDFEDLKWVRYIQNEIHLPSVVSHFLRKIGYDELEGKEVIIPEGMEHQARCLQKFYKQYYETDDSMISRSNAEEITAQNAVPEVNVNFLLTVGILKEKDADTLSWGGGEYTRHLNSEICATIWLLLTAENNDTVSFSRFFRILREAQLWPYQLTAFLDSNNINRLCDNVVKLIEEENDLLQSDDEIKKIWLDGPGYSHHNIDTPIPAFKFDYSSTTLFLESVEYCTYHYHDVVDYQGIRSSYNLALQILLEGDRVCQNPYSRILKLFQDTSRPYIVWELYSDIKRRYPEVIPYLLTVPGLAVIAYKVLDEINLHPTFLQYSEHRDGTFEQSCEIKSKLWLEFFEISLAQLHVHTVDKESGDYLSSILLDIANKVFLNTSNIYGNTQHLQYKKRYEQVLKILRSWRDSGTYGMSLEVRPRRILYFLPLIVSSLQKKFADRPLPRNGYIHLQSGLFDLSIEMIRLSNIRTTEKEVHALLRTKIDIAVYDLLRELAQQVQNFYSISHIDTMKYDLSTKELLPVNRHVNTFGFEIVDWGYLFLNFHRRSLHNDIYQSFLDSLDIKIDENEWDEQNKVQRDKIQLYLLSIMIAFMSVIKHRDSYEIEGLPVNEVKAYLQTQIETLAIKYSLNSVSESRLDVFDDRIIFKNTLYHQRLTDLLFRCINEFDKEVQERFIDSFFHDSIDLGRMLEAVNVLESKKLTAILSRKISSISIKKFIDASFFTMELKSALIDAANSEEHWELAKPLLTMLQKHFQKIRIQDHNTNDLLFEVDLLIAFKEKDIERLKSISVPQKDTHNDEHNLRLRHLKEFFTALHLLHNEKKYVDAVEILRMLHSHSPTSIRFAFKLFEAETELALKTNDFALLKKANVDWQDFEDTASDSEVVSGYREAVSANKLHYYASIKDTVMFDHTINILTSRYLYDETVLPSVYRYYTAQNLHELAHSYIIKAQEYYKHNELTIPSVIQEVLDEAPSDYLLSQYKMSLVGIRSLPYEVIPKIVPEVLNGEKKLDEFILAELIHATKVLLDKIHSIRQITHENRYNDLLLACLRLRLPFYGWTIQDQSRKGKSPTDIDAGEIDLVIEAGGQPIALVEALILKSNEVAKTQQHIRKCFGYINYLSRYYIISYYKGESDKFDYIWEKYGENILKAKLPSHAQINLIAGFKDISDIFKDARHLKVGVTLHNGNTKMFHLMVRLT